MSAGEVKAQYTVEHADAQFIRPRFEPPVEYPAEKIAVLFRRYTELCDFTRRRVLLNAWYELQELEFILHEKIKKLIGAANIFVVEQGQDIKLNAELTAVFYRAYHPLE